MLKLGKLTDYAVVLLVQLARESGACSAIELADKTGLPAPTVSKVLKKISGGKLVESVRGASGGYRMARGLSDIRVLDVIEAMEGPVALTSCVGGSCKTESKCSVRGKWSPVNDAVTAALSNITLADMAPNAYFNISPAKVAHVGIH